MITFKVPGKWVLAGEHSVLRGGKALAFTHNNYFLNIEYVSSDAANKFSVVPDEASSDIYNLIRSVEKKIKKEIISNLNGTLKITNTIPIGAGFGSSAALCVAAAKLLVELNFLKQEEYLEIATQMENIFHGKSSGMDVAAVSADEPIVFSLSARAWPIGVKKLPKFTFHDTGLRSKTKDCIKKVEKLFVKNPKFAKEIDVKMEAATELAIQGLLLYQENRSAKDGFGMVANAMESAQSCFYDWGLVPESVKKLVDSLTLDGALAVKLTGSGDGGFLVALWPD